MACIGCLVAGSESRAQAAVDAGVISVLVPIAMDPSPNEASSDAADTLKLLGRGKNGKECIIM